MNLLVVEDDKLMQEVIADYFGSKEWTVSVCDNGEDALELIKTNTCHLILLDVMLPGMNGFSVCRRIREISDVPVIFLTARVQDEDKLNGYAMGADDYMTKPFSLPVLYAKSMALMSRMLGTVPDKMIRCKTIRIDVRTHEVWSNDRSCILAPMEYDILLFFIENPNRIFSREQLLIRFWGYDFDGSERVVDNHIKKLRKALGESGNMIKTVRKAGYRMEI
ncbi:MAG: response regulator transcription factor [Coprococcus sp.]